MSYASIEQELQKNAELQVRVDKLEKALLRVREIAMEDASDVEGVSAIEKAISIQAICEDALEPHLCPHYFTLGPCADYGFGPLQKS